MYLFQRVEADFIVEVEKIGADMLIKVKYPQHNIDISLVFDEIPLEEMLCKLLAELRKGKPDYLARLLG